MKNQNKKTAYDLTVMLAEEDTSTVRQVIEDEGGSEIKENVTKVTFAYEISGNDQGYMAVFTFFMDPEHADTLNKKLKLEQSVLRHMLLRDTLKDKKTQKKDQNKKPSKSLEKKKKESDELLSNEAIEQKIEEISD